MSHDYNKTNIINILSKDLMLNKTKLAILSLVSGLTFYEIEKIFESVIENLKQAVIITPTEVMLIEKDATKVNVHIESKISNLENEVL